MSARPRVAINAHLLSFGTTYRGAGISRHIRNLAWTLPAVAPDLELTVLLGDRNAPPGLRRVRDLRYRFSRLPTVRPPVRILWEQFVLPLLLRPPLSGMGGGFDLLHSPGYAQPLLMRGVPGVLTIHDLSFELFPQAFNAPNRAYLRFITRRSARGAARIIAVSESTRRDAARLLGVSEGRIVVVHNGLEPTYRRLDPVAVEAFRRERGLPERFILFLGTLEPRKNVETLVRAFARLRRHGLPHHLVIAGAKGWLFDRIFAMTEELGLGALTHFPGYVVGGEEPLWYNAADLFAYPSRYEGFGFPPLEAMACGTPVVTSNTSSLPEVVGEAGLLIDPTDEVALAETMATVLRDRDLHAHLAEAGRRRAARFSWPRAAAQTADVYRAALTALGAPQSGLDRHHPGQPSRETRGRPTRDGDRTD